MSKYRRLGKNTVLVFIGNTGSKFIAILMLPFYTKWLSVEDYGTYDLITIYVSFLLGIVTMSIAESIFIFPKDKPHKEQKEYFSSGLCVSLVGLSVAAMLFIVAREIFSYFNISNSFTEYTFIIFWMIVATFFQKYLQQFSRGIDKIFIYSISGIILTATMAGFAFLLIPKFGVKGYIFSQILALVITSLFTFIATKAYNFLSVPSIKKAVYKQMLYFSIPLIPNGIMWWLVSALNRPVMEAYLGMHSIGLFAVANKFPSIMTMVFSVFILSWQISVLEEFKKPGYKDFYNKILRIIFSLLTLISCGITILSKPMVSIMADEKFIDAWKVIPILSFAVLFSSLSGFVGTNFSATKESKYYFYSSIWGAGTSIILNFVLIPRFGLTGAALSVVCSFLIMALVRIKYSWKYVKIISPLFYISMLILNIFFIITAIKIDDIRYKTFIYGLLLIIYLILNKKLFPDFLNLLSNSKSKLYKNKNERNI